MVLGALVVLVGFTWFVDKVVRAIKVARAPDEQVSYLPSGLGAGGRLESPDSNDPSRFAKPAFGDEQSNLTFVLVCAAAAVVALVGSLQRFVERALFNFVNEVGGSYGRDRLGTELNIGSVGAWLLCGRVVIRNVVLRGPRGFNSEHLLLARRVSVQLGLPAVIRAVLGGGVEVQSLRIEGLDVAVEHESDLSSRTNVQVVLSHIEEPLSQAADLPVRSVGVAVRSASTHRGVVRRLATPTGAGVSDVSGALLTSIPDRHFSKDLRLTGDAGDVLAVFAQTILGDARAAIQSL